jgi:hypothetical protein
MVVHVMALRSSADASFVSQRTSPSFPLGWLALNRIAHYSEYTLVSFLLILGRLIPEAQFTLEVSNTLQCQLAVRRNITLRLLHLIFTQLIFRSKNEHIATTTASWNRSRGLYHRFV